MGVCVIVQGATTTEVSEGVIDENYPAFMRKHARKGGAMKPEDIAAAILFVVSRPARADASELLIRSTIDIAPTRITLNPQPITSRGTLTYLPPELDARAVGIGAEHEVAH